MIEKLLIPTALVIGYNVDNNIINQIDNEFNYYKTTPCYTKIEIEKIVIKIVAKKKGCSENKITSESHFVNDIGADSLDVVEIIMEFEEEFNIAIPDIEADKMNTIGSAVNFIYDKYLNAVSVFSESDFNGNKRCLVNDDNGKSDSFIENGVTSIVVPQGFIVKLFTNRDYDGESITISSKNGRIEISNLTKVKETDFIKFSVKDIKWNDNVKSITIRTIDD